MNTSIKHMTRRRNKIAKLLSTAVKEREGNKAALQHILDEACMLKVNIEVQAKNIESLEKIVRNYNTILEDSKELWQHPEEDIKDSTTAKILEGLGLLK